MAGVEFRERTDVTPLESVDGGTRMLKATETLAGGSEAQLAVTSSGATMSPISIDSAARFLSFFDARVPHPIAIALGAYQDEHTLIGVATLGSEANRCASVIVVVAPSCRRLKVGSDLLHAIVAAAAVSGVRCLLATYPEHAVAADAFARSHGIVAHQLSADAEVTVQLAVPEVR